MLHNHMFRFLLFLAVVLLEFLLALFWFFYADQSYYPFAFFLLMTSLYCFYHAYRYLQRGVARARKVAVARKYFDSTIVKASNKV